MILLLKAIGLVTLLAIAVITILVIKASPHGAATLLTHANHQVGSYATRIASRLPSPEASP